MRVSSGGSAHTRCEGRMPLTLTLTLTLTKCAHALCGEDARGLPRALRAEDAGVVVAAAELHGHAPVAAPPPG